MKTISTVHFVPFPVHDYSRNVFEICVFFMRLLSVYEPILSFFQFIWMVQNSQKGIFSTVFADSTLRGFQISGSFHEAEIFKWPQTAPIQGGPAQTLPYQLRVPLGPIRWRLGSLALTLRELGSLDFVQKFAFLKLLWNFPKCWNLRVVWTSVAPLTFYAVDGFNQMTVTRNELYQNPCKIYQSRLYKPADAAWESSLELSGHPAVVIGVQRDIAVCIQGV